MRALGFLVAAIVLAGCVAPPRDYGPAYAVRAPTPFGARPEGRYAAFDPRFQTAYAPGRMGVVPEDRAAARAAPRPVPAAAAPARANRPAGPEAPVPLAATPVRGPETVPAVAGGGPECRTVDQVGYADGREVRRAERLCRSAGGAWERP